MNIWLVCFCAAVLAVGFFPSLPPLLPLLLLIVIAAVFVRYCRVFRYGHFWHWPLTMLLAMLLGISWGTLTGIHYLERLLPVELERQDVLVSGRIVGLPQRDTRRQGFTLAVEQVQDFSGQPVTGHFPERVQINWYGGPSVMAGESWQLVVRLRRPRGFVNPGGFDYQAWLMRRGIGAVGYVREDERNRFVSAPQALDVSYWRYHLQQWLLSHTEHQERAVLLALLIGDRSLFYPDLWSLLINTGTNHLTAISGLHIGFVALLGFFLGAGAGRVINLVWPRCPAVVPGYLLAIVCAAFYSALAGFNVPTQRALIMVLVVQLAFVLRRSYRSLDVFILALTGVVIMDPLAAFDLGFWLSFGAVAVLMFGFSGRLRSFHRPLGAHLFQAQWLIFIGLLVPLSILINSVSLIAPVANLLAIPLVTFLMVPPLLLAAVVHGVWPGLARLALWVAERALDLLLYWLQLLTQLGGDYFHSPLVFSRWSLLLAIISVLVLLLPKGLPGRRLGYPALMLAVFLPAAPQPPLTLTALEVGQGLSLVIRTSNHVLVYDAGPSYSDRFEAGAGIVAPYLRRVGVRHLDTLVVSHHHNDHAGGAPGLLGIFPAAQVWAGEPDRHQHWGYTVENCRDSDPWQWDGIQFTFLVWPMAANASANNRSCVLLIDYDGQQILLTGDIEAPAEHGLLRADLLPERIQVLQVPHHGSRTSSTQGFVEHLQPQHVIYSAAYRGRHQHPHPDVAERYRAIGSQPFNTGAQGAVRFIWQSPGEPEVIAWREHRRRYWYD